MADPPESNQNLPGRSRLRNALFWGLLFCVVALVIAIIAIGLTVSGG